VTLTPQSPHARALNHIWSESRACIAEGQSWRGPFTIAARIVALSLVVPGRENQHYFFVEIEDGGCTQVCECIRTSNVAFFSTVGNNSVQHVDGGNDESQSTCVLMRCKSAQVRPLLRVGDLCELTNLMVSRTMRGRTGERLLLTSTDDTQVCSNFCCTRMCVCACVCVCQRPLKAAVL